MPWAGRTTIIMITIYKNHTNHNIAHLYEHMFVARIIKQLREMNYFQYVDYDIHATTYYSGHIVITGTTYDQSLQNTLTALLNTKYTYTEKELSIAMSQIIAEYKVFFDGKGVRAVENAIANLENTHWLGLADINTIAVQNKPRQTSLLLATNYPAQQKLIRISLEFPYSIEQPSSVAAFRQLANIISDNCNDYACDTLGTFIEETRYYQNSKVARLESLLTTTKRQDIAITAIIEAYANCYNYLKNAGAIYKFANEILNSPPNYEQAPSFHGSIVDTKYIIGTPGWHSILSKDTITNILSAITLTVKIGKTKITTKLDIK